MALIKDIPAGYNPVLPDEVYFEERAERALEEAARKLIEPLVCTSCDAVLMDGRWHWAPVPVSANQGICPACQRVQEHRPAGIVTLTGDYFGQHRQEILDTLHELAERKRGENPLLRIMEEAMVGDGMEILTTDIRLAHLVGGALHHHYQGEIGYYHNDAEGLLRVYWYR